jgi:hypothetical protein
LAIGILDLLLQIVPLILSARVAAEKTNLFGLMIHSMRTDIVSAFGDLPHFLPMVNCGVARYIESRLDVILVKQI